MEAYLNLKWGADIIQFGDEEGSIVFEFGGGRGKLVDNLLDEGRLELKFLVGVLIYFNITEGEGITYINWGGGGKKKVPDWDYVCFLE